MGRRKLTEEELIQKQQEKEEQKKLELERISKFKEELSSTILQMDDKLISDFVKTSKKYDGLLQQELMELIFKKFAKEEFKFKTVTRYE